jgi:hypothetical protein
MDLNLSLFTPGCTHSYLPTVYIRYVQLVLSSPKSKAHVRFVTSIPESRMQHETGLRQPQRRETRNESYPCQTVIPSVCYYRRVSMCTVLVVHRESNKLVITTPLYYSRLYACYQVPGTRHLVLPVVLVLDTGLHSLILYMHCTALKSVKFPLLLSFLQGVVIALLTSYILYSANILRLDTHHR